MWEGGIRVPFIVRGPGVKPNSWCHARVVGYDLLPTFCQWAGVPRHKLPTGLEGGSLAHLLANDGKGQVQRARDELVFHFPHYQSGDGPHYAVLLGDWKLMKFHETGRLSLFDLSKDVGERNDLSRRMSQEANRLHDRLNRYLTAVDAQMPRVNPRFDSDRAPSPRKRNRRRN